ncbi:transmembrane protein 276-like isoform X2 [Salminus brasiliensis]
MDAVQELMNVSVDIILALSALNAAFHLFKDHRAPSVGFLLVACSSALAVLPASTPSLAAAQKDLEWAAEALGPVLSAFGFLWLSEDRSTAHVLLIGSTLLPLLADWLSVDGLVVMSRCVGLSALSCSLTVCLFAGNAAGVVGSVALSLPALVAPRVRGAALGSITSPQAAGGLLRWMLKAVMAGGCWTTKTALNKFLQDLKGWD